MNLAGVDEAGRGPLAGAVFAAAVILDETRPVNGLADSKKLSASKRADLEIKIKETAIAWAVAHASVAEIDRINILQASLLAMKRAVESLQVRPDLVRVDGNKLPEIAYPAIAVIGGDAIYEEISAASILAKQARDLDMIKLAKIFPNYGFENHKGYPTKLHIEALQVHGVTDHHRRSFAPVRRIIDQ